MIFFHTRNLLFSYGSPLQSQSMVTSSHLEFLCPRIPKQVVLVLSILALLLLYFSPGQTYAESADPDSLKLKELEQYLNKSTLEQKIWDAELDKLKTWLPYSDRAGPEGHITVQDTLGLELRVLAFSQLEKVATAIADELAPNVDGKRLVVFDESLLESLLLYQTHSQLASRLERMSQQILGESDETVRYGIHPGAALAALDLTIRSIGGFVRLFSSDVSFSGISMPRPSSQLISMVSNRLEGADIVLPKYAVPLVDGDAEMVQTLVRLESHIGKMKRIALGLDDDDAAELSEFIRAASKYMDSLHAMDESGVSTLAKMIRFERLAQDLSKPETLWLAIEVTDSYGGFKNTQKAIASDKAEFSAQVQASYWLVRADGTVVTANHLQRFSPYKKVKNIVGE